MAEIQLLFVGDFSKLFPAYMMFPFKAMIICKIQLRTENQLGKGQKEKVLLPFSRDTRCNLIQNSRGLVKSSWVQTHRNEWIGITMKMHGQRIHGAEEEGPWDLVKIIFHSCEWEVNNWTVVSLSAQSCRLQNLRLHLKREEFCKSCYILCLADSYCTS